MSGKKKNTQQQQTQKKDKLLFQPFFFFQLYLENTTTDIKKPQVSSLKPQQEKPRKKQKTFQHRKEKKKQMSHQQYPEDAVFQRLYPPNTIIRLSLEVARAKKIFQHEDNARTTSTFVETYFANADEVVGRGWLPDLSAAATAEKELVKTPRKGRPTVTPSWSSETSNALVLGETKTVTESSDPFFNHPFEYVFNPNEDESNNNNNNNNPHHHQALFRFRVVDSNYDPARPICLASVMVPLNKNGKGEVTLNTVLDPELAKAASASSEPFERTSMKDYTTNNPSGIWPSAEQLLLLQQQQQQGNSIDAAAASSLNNNSNNAGTLVVRWTVKITKPKPPVRDPEADIELTDENNKKKPVKLSGDSVMVPSVQQGYGLHTVLPGLVLFSDPDFTLKFNKALIKILGGLYDEEVASKSPKRRGGGGMSGMGSSMMSRSMTATSGGGGDANNNTSAASSDHCDKVIVNYWKCKRSHQVHTKVRLAAERCLRHEQVLAFTSDEEAEYKLWWKQQAAILEVGVTNPQLENQSSALRLMYDKIWVMMVTGDDETESGSLWTPNFEQRTKLQYVVWGPTQYAALQGAFLKLVLPTLSDRAALEIGVEDFKADEIIQDMMHTASQQVSARAGGGITSTTSNQNNSMMAASQSMMNRSTTNSKSVKLSEKDQLLADFAEMCAPLDKAHIPVRGDFAQKVFQRQTSDFLHRWQATMTETEQITMLKSCANVIQTFARPFSGFQTEKPKRAKSGKLASSGKK